MKKNSEEQLCLSEKNETTKVNEDLQKEFPAT